MTRDGGISSMTAEATYTIRPAKSDSELTKIQEFKYRIYVQEMGRYGDIADHENQLLAEVDDANSHNFLIEDGDRMIGTARMTWGGDAGALASGSRS